MGYELREVGNASCRLVYRGEDIGSVLRGGTHSFATLEELRDWLE
jgi:hypothetical protein